MVLEFDSTAFFLGTFLRLFLHSLWYSPVLFGNKLRDLNPKCSEENAKETSFLRQIVFQYIISSIGLFIHYKLLIWYSQDLYGSLFFCLIIFLGFHIPGNIQPMLWEGKTFTHFWLNSGLQLLSIISFTCFVFKYKEYYSH